MKRYAIRHTFPNGGTVGDGLIHAGNTYPQPVATYDAAEAEATAAHMRLVNPGHVFEVVPAPEFEYTGFEAGAL